MAGSFFQYPTLINFCFKIGKQAYWWRILKRLEHITAIILHIEDRRREGKETVAEYMDGYTKQEISYKTAEEINFAPFNFNQFISYTFFIFVNYLTTLFYKSIFIPPITFYLYKFLDKKYGISTQMMQICAFIGL